MTEKQAYKTIADRAQEMAKDEKIKEKCWRKFGNNLAEVERYVYMLAIATLYGETNKQGAAKGEQHD